MGMEDKVTPEWYKIKKIPKGEWVYCGSWAGKLLFNTNNGRFGSIVQRSYCRNFNYFNIE